MRKKSLPYRHFERSREIFIAARKSASLCHFINEVLVLRFSAISYLLFTGVQERFEGSARNDDMRENDSCHFPLPSHQSLVTSHQTLTYCKIFFPLFFLERLYAKIIRLCRKKKALCRYFFIESNISLGIMGLSCFFGVFVKVKEDGGLWVIFL